MGKYLPKAVDTIEFDGDKVEVRVERISMTDAMAFNGMQKDDVMAGTIEMLKKYKFEVRGLTDASGADISVDVIYHNFYFEKLINKAATLLMSTGSVPKELEHPLDKSWTSSS